MWGEDREETGRCSVSAAFRYRCRKRCIVGAPRLKSRVCNINISIRAIYSKEKNGSFLQANDLKIHMVQTTTNIIVIIAMKFHYLSFVICVVSDVDEVSDLWRIDLLKLCRNEHAGGADQLQLRAHDRHDREEAVGDGDRKVERLDLQLELVGDLD